MLSPYQRMAQSLLIRVRPNILASFLKPLLGVRRVVLPTPQGRFWIDPVSLLGIALTRHSGFEQAMTTTLARFLGPGGSFVDLGANEGYFTTIGARLCGPGGRVISIEPQQRLLPVIQENLRLNALDNTTIINAAITDQEGTATLHLTADTNSGASGLYRHTRYTLPTQQVATLTLEQALDQQQLQTIDLMKVDIEGFEYEALLGSPRVFQQHRIRALALELHPTILAGRGKDSRDIITMLESSGYRLTGTSENQVWTAPAPSAA